MDCNQNVITPPAISGADRIRQNKERRAERDRRGQECLEFLKVLHPQGSVFEIRALAVGGKDPRKDSGYFDDPLKAAQAVIKLDEEQPPRGIYVTLNPVIKDLLARSNNRLTDWAKTMSGDVDVVTRRWLFVDLDPERPIGISATSSEKQAAIERAEAVREWLMSEFGFGEPVECDSGNGRYLLWPIDLSNDEHSTALVRDVLTTISEHCGTTAVKIDTKVSNASRILRLPGTFNRKGDSTEDRPHRLAAVVQVPDYLRNGWSEPIPREKLEAVAALLPHGPRELAGRDARLTPQKKDRVQRGDATERAHAYVAKMPSSVMGQNGSRDAFKVALVLVRGFNLTDGDAFNVMLEFSQSCEPPWSESEIRHKIEDAREKGKAPFGYLLRENSIEVGRSPAVVKLSPRQRVKMVDSEQFGTVVEDRGEVCLIRFLQPDDSTEDREVAKVQLVAPDGKPLTEDGFDLRLMRSDEFSKADFRRHFLIKGVLVEGQHGVVGGPQKALKTGLMLDMAVSLGTATPFLSDQRFICSERVPTCLLSGESGGFTLKETAFRICEARNAFLPTADILWGFELPQLANPIHLEVMARTFKNEGIKVAMIDPAYLCLLSGDTQGRSPANVFAMGSILKEVSQMAQEAKCTLLIAHHTRKAGRDDKFGATSLEDLSMSGFPEWARQWLLIGRRSEFKDGIHLLSLNVGGSAGHSGSYFLTVDEGIANDDHAQRKWDVRVETASEGIERTKSAKEAAKADARRDKLERLNDVVGKYPDGETKSVLRANAVLNSNDFDDLIAELIKRKAVEPCQVTKGNKKHPGFRRMTLEPVTRNDPEQVGNSESVRLTA